MKKTKTRSPKSQVTTKKNKENVLSFGVLNLRVPEHIEEPQNIENVRTEWIEWGCDNLFPQYLAELKRQSPTHRAILTQKATYSAGKGFSCSDESLTRFFKRVNADSESMRDVYKKLVDDYYVFGNAFMEIVQYDGGFNIYHIDATTVRVAKDHSGIYVNPDWAEYRRLADKMQFIPFYPSFTESRCVIQFKDYEPTFHYYGLSDYIGSLEHIASDYEISKWNHSKFKTAFQPSALIEINGDMSQEEAKKMVREAQKKWVGEGNQGKIMFIVKGSGDTTPANVQIIKDDNDGAWDVLQEITIQAIHTAHRWQPSLSGVVSSGKMNSTGSEIRIAYEIVQNTIINETTEVFLDVFKKVFRDLGGYDTDEMTLVFEPPISYLSDIKATDVLTINEQREILGMQGIEGGDVFYVQLKGGTQAKVDEEIIDDVADKGNEVNENLEIETNDL